MNFYIYRSDFSFWFELSELQVFPKFQQSNQLILSRFEFIDGVSAKLSDLSNEVESSFAKNVKLLLSQSLMNI